MSLSPGNAESHLPERQDIRLLYGELLSQLERSWVGLEDKPEETPELALKALWLAASGKPQSLQQIRAIPPNLPDEIDTCRLRLLVARRSSGEPLAFLTGRQNFMGVEMLASPGAMIPRKETELLGKVALQVLRKLVRERGNVKMADLCTGSGNLALALARLVPECRAWGIDLSAEAVELARQNAAFLGLEERAEFIQGDLFKPLADIQLDCGLDLVTCNPPYISSRRVDVLPQEISSFEPRMAFDGGPFGISVITRLFREAPAFMKPGSSLVFEVGLGQGETIGRMIVKSGLYSHVQTFQDERGAVRAIQAVRA